MTAYRLATEGDRYEQELAVLFADREFPEYEAFWNAFVVPLTGRDENPPNIGLKSDGEIAALDETPEAVCLAELHYSLLLHLGQAYKVLQRQVATIEDLFEGVVHLSASLDIADELLGRFTNRNLYEAWGEASGRRARREWREGKAYPLQEIRSYRNRLVHGRLVPNFEIHVREGAQVVGLLILFPRIGREAHYDDWRLLPALTRAEIERDFDPGRAVLEDAWRRVIGYVREQWRSVLLGGS